jgi:uncharacterized protein (DUF885 family)
MPIRRRDFLVSTASLLAAQALPVHALAAAGTDADAAARALLDAIAERLLGLFPESATSLGIDRGHRAALRSRLSDRSAAGQRAIAAQLAADTARLRALDPDALAPATRIDLEVALTAFDIAAEGFGFDFGDVSVGGYRNTPYVVAQNVGAYIDVPQFLDSDHTVQTPADAEAWLARLESWPVQLDGETERLRADAAQGVIAPDFLLDKALATLAMARRGDVKDWSVVASLAKRTQGMQGDFAARAAKLASERLAPALDRQIAELQRQRERANPDAGAWKLPQGEAYYAWALRAGTTTTLEPEAVHARGLEELRALQAEMDTILRAQGYTQGSVGERMTAIGNEARFRYPDDDTGRAQIMAMLNARLQAMREHMPTLFGHPVKGHLEVTRLPPEAEAGGAGAYGGPGAIDGSVPGRFWINLRTTELWRSYSLPTLAYHEAIPGHVWQGEYSFRLPLIRSLLAFNAYSEGWALYAEQLADELGVYAEDPFGRLGYLQSIAFRACRLVVDTGLHAKRWTREQAITWFMTANGSPREEIEGEVDRYCSWPGQACGYKLGHSEIVRLRRLAEDTLGAHYDRRDFNDAVVGNGNVPMNVLAGVVQRYIDAQNTKDQGVVVLAF